MQKCQTITFEALEDETFTAEEASAQFLGEGDLYFDALGGRRLSQPAWITAREQTLDDYRESVRTAHRQHRDTLRLYRDAMRSAYAPWSRPYRDWAEMRSYVTQME